LGFKRIRCLLRNGANFNGSEDGGGQTFLDALGQPTRLVKRDEHWRKYYKLKINFRKLNRPKETGPPQRKAELIFDGEVDDM